MLKYLILALLAEGPRHGYELKGVFDETFGASWPLSLAQIYTVLTKLQSEGLIDCVVVHQDNLPSRKVFSLTDAGHEELAAWQETPVAGPVRLRDELYLKVLVNMTAAPTQSATFIARQRQAHLQTLAELDRVEADGTLDRGTRLLVEGAALRIEAELRWLERCEEQLESSP